MMRKLCFILWLTLAGVSGGGGARVFAQANPSTAVNPVVRAAMSLPQVDVSAPVVIDAEFDPPVVGVGEKAIYRLTVNALETAVVWPQQLALPPGLQLKQSAHGQVLQNVGGEVRPMTALNFSVVADRTGYFPIPVFFADVNGNPVIVPEAVLKVVPKSDVPHLPTRRLVLKPASTNVFFGDPVTVFTYLPANGSNQVEGVTQLQFSGGGFLEGKNDFRQAIKPVDLDGQKIMAYVGESRLTPIATGPQTLSVQAFTSGAQFNGQIIITGNTVIPGGPPRYVLVESEPVTINVRPLPPEGVLPGFTGFIGNLTTLPPQVSTNALRVGDALQLSVTFVSDSSLTRFDPPPAPRVADWEVFAPAAAATPANLVAPGKFNVTYAYTMIPLSPDIRHTPAIPFSIFDREKAAYVDRSIPALDLQVSIEGMPAEWKSGSAAGDAAGAERPHTLSKLANTSGKTVRSLVPLQLRPWFLAVQVAPALGLLALWLWDRRRRFLEAHPEIVRRRQARRALRREQRALNRAASAGDARAFGARAVAALQIAAAPHFPAVPRALVCGEVLSVLDEAERQGRAGDVVRSLFAQDEAANFAADRDPQASLLALRSDLEKILERMEARL